MIGPRRCSLVEGHQVLDALRTIISARGRDGRSRDRRRGKGGRGRIRPEGQGRQHPALSIRPVRKERETKRAVIVSDRDVPQRGCRSRHAHNVRRPVHARRCATPLTNNWPVHDSLLTDPDPREVQKRSRPCGTGPLTGGKRLDAHGRRHALGAQIDPAQINAEQASPPGADLHQKFERTSRAGRQTKSSSASICLPVAADGGRIATRSSWP